MSASGAAVGERIHLDLLRADATGPPTRAAREWPYVDVSDPTVHGRLWSGPSPCAGTGEGRSVEEWRCLSGGVTVDVSGAGAPAHLFVVLFPVPVDEQPEFDEWFAHEHARLLTEAPTWSRARLVVLDQGDHPESGAPFTRMAVHDLQELSALDSAERRKAGQTDRTRQLFARPWATAVRRHVMAGR